jgi:hypothetical protein
MKNLSQSQKKDLVRSRLIAEQAEKDPQVLEFRREVLNGKILELADIPKWIQQTNKLDCQLRNVSGYSPEMLEWGEDGVVHRLPIRQGGKLHLLYDLATDLARQYGWKRVEAVHFILGNQKFVLPSLAASVLPDEITIRIYHYVSPRELADFYRKVRREYGFKNQRERKQVAADGLPAKSARQQTRRQERKLLNSSVDPIELFAKAIGAKRVKSSALTTRAAKKQLKRSRSTLYRHAKKGKVQKVRSDGGVRWIPTRGKSEETAS